MRTALSYTVRFLRRLAVGALLVVFILSWRESDLIRALPEVDRQTRLEELSRSQTVMFEEWEQTLPFLGRSLSTRAGSGLEVNASPATIQREVVLADSTLLGLSAFGIITLLIPPRRPKPALT
jgi:hypothetical protein